MPQMTHPNGDVRVIPVALVEKYQTRGWEVTNVTVTEVIASLKGAELDAALTNAGLPKTGKAADKRARLTEHANRLDTTPEEQA